MAGAVELTPGSDPASEVRLAGRPAPGDAWIVLDGSDHVLVAAHDPAVFEHVDVRVAADLPPILIDRDAHRRTWLTTVADGTDPPDGTMFAPAWELIGVLGPGRFARFARARMLAAWQRDHRFCGRCGAATHSAADEHAAVCPRCGLRSYPRISPVVIVRVTRGDEILLARPVRAGRRLYSVLAGFVEAGESLEQTVVREIAEEVGIAIGDLAYFGSQPWPFPHALMVAFTAAWAAGQITPDSGEIVDAGWYGAGDLPPVPPQGSIARALIDDFTRGRTGR
jgi:NAD+ diphosphatase